MSPKVWIGLAPVALVVMYVGLIRGNLEADSPGGADPPEAALVCPDWGGEIDRLRQRDAELDRAIRVAHRRTRWLDLHQSVLYNRRDVGPRPPGLGPFPDLPGEFTCEGAR